MTHRITTSSSILQEQAPNQVLKKKQQQKVNAEITEAKANTKAEEKVTAEEVEDESFARENEIRGQEIDALRSLLNKNTNGHQLGNDSNNPVQTSRKLKTIQLNKPSNETARKVLFPEPSIRAEEQRPTNRHQKSLVDNIKTYDISTSPQTDSDVDDCSCPPTVPASPEKKENYKENILIIDEAYVEAQRQRPDYYDSCPPTVPVSQENSPENSPQKPSMKELRKGELIVPVSQENSPQKPSVNKRKRQDISTDEKVILMDIDSPSSKNQTPAGSFMSIESKSEPGSPMDISPGRSPQFKTTNDKREREGNNNLRSNKPAVCKRLRFGETPGNPGNNLSGLFHPASILTPQANSFEHNWSSTTDFSKGDAMCQEDDEVMGVAPMQISPIKNAPTRG